MGQNEYGLQRLKGMYSYEWLVSLDKLNEIQLPSKEAVYFNIMQCE